MRVRFFLKTNGIFHVYCNVNLVSRVRLLIFIIWCVERWNSFIYTNNDLILSLKKRKNEKKNSFRKAPSSIGNGYKTRFCHKVQYFVCLDHDTSFASMWYKFFQGTYGGTSMSLSMSASAKVTRKRLVSKVLQNWYFKVWSHSIYS